jgi:deoxycytidine triphosphate deaminase
LAVLSKDRIQKRLGDVFEAGTFDESGIDRAAYNLHLDDQEIIVDGNLYYHDENPYRTSEHHGRIILPARKITIVTSIERFHMPADLVARGGVSLRLANKGLIGLFGPQIDPGYSGPFIAVVWNSGPDDLELNKGDHIVKLEFHTLESPSTEKPRPPKSIKEMDRRITEKSLLEDIDRRFRSVQDQVDKLNSGENENRLKLSEIEKSYQTIVLFGVFLVASAVIGVVLGELSSQISSLSGLVDKSVLEAIVLAYFISIPVLAALLFVLILRRRQ